MHAAVEWLVRSDEVQPAEGPVWDDREGVLWWVDIMGHAVHRHDPTDGSDTVLDVGQPVGAVALRESGGLLAYLADGLALLDPRTGALERVVDLEAAATHLRSNDGKAGPDGCFWGGSMALDLSHGQGSLYRVEPDGTTQRLLADVSISNGLDWITPHRLYYVDSYAHGLDVLDVDLDRGRVVARTRLVDLPEPEGLFDGLTVDATGDVWIAVHGGGEVRRYSPRGKLVGRVDVPTDLVTSVCFGGEDLTDLYITAAASESQAGGLLRCHVGVAGRAPNRFAG